LQGFGIKIYRKPQAPGESNPLKSILQC
jgi:hypothetical protein